MSGLGTKLHRAKAKLLGTAAAEIAVPFELRCECGRRLTGIRRPSWQQITCPACGTAQFVLPVNVFPATRSVPSEVVSGPFTARLLAATRELLPQTSAAPAASPDRSRESRQRDGGQRMRQVPSPDPSDSEPGDPYPPLGRAVAPDAPAASRRARSERRDGTGAAVAASEDAEDRRIPQLTLPAIDVRRVARRTFTPFRLLMVGVVLVASVTAWWTWNRNRLENARQEWRDSMDLAETALREGQLDELQSALESAVQAATILQRRDEEVQSADSLLIQTRALNQLSTVDLVAELSSAVDAAGQPDFSRTADVQNALKNGWYIFDCRVRPLDPAQSLVQLDLPLAIGRGGIEIQVASSLLHEAAAVMPQSSLLFVAQIQSCESPGGGSNNWRIWLKPDSCALLTSTLHATEAGLDTTDRSPVSVQLQRQQEFLSSSDLYALRDRDQQRSQTDAAVSTGAADHRGEQHE